MHKVKKIAVRRNDKGGMYMKFIAHRGACLELQEDTLAALNKAADYGAFAVECDLRYTADGVLVIYHDRELTRLTGNESRVIDITYAEMKRILAESGKTLTTFEELVNGFNRKSAVLFDISFDALEKDFYRRISDVPFRAIAGIHAIEEAKLASEYFAKENILAFLPKDGVPAQFAEAGAGNIRLWEHWTDTLPVQEVRKTLPQDREIWIMARDGSIKHPLFCMNGSRASIEKFTACGADAMLLNDIKLAVEANK